MGSNGRSGPETPNPTVDAESGEGCTVARLHDSQERDTPALAKSDDILELLAGDLRRVGLVGDRVNLCKLIYLALVSRLDSRPVSLVVKGPSSAGKSWPVEQVLKFCPDSAYYTLTAMSDKALIYDDRPISHRFIVLYEAVGISGQTMELMIRSLLSEGRIDYSVTEKGDDGRYRTRHIQREGPSGLLTTTTAIKLHAENETRYLSVLVSDSAEDTRDVMKAWANAAARKPTEAVDYEQWHALGHWLEANDSHEVVIPFAPRIADLVGGNAMRLKRDFIQLLALIRAHALLHRATRQVDGGAIVATLRDYEAVRELVEPIIGQATEISIDASVRDTVRAVEELLPLHKDGVPQSALKARLGVDKSAVSRRVKRALSEGYLRDERERPYLPSRLFSADPLPEDQDVLPLASALMPSLKSYNRATVQPLAETQAASGFEGDAPTATPATLPDWANDDEPLAIASPNVQFQEADESDERELERLREKWGGA